MVKSFIWWDDLLRDDTHYATIYKHKPCQNRNYHVLTPTPATQKNQCYYVLTVLAG